MTDKKETLAFQAEVKQLLHLVTHSLYSNKEIFLRELISNASDALDKLRFAALSDNALYENDNNLQIEVNFDSKKRTITVSDNGIGMSREEIIDNLGTIAKSGTKSFLESLTAKQAGDAHLIGQFGVGFYASFVVSDKVTVKSRHAGMRKEEGIIWESDGSGEYTVSVAEKEKRGTEIILHLKKDEDEFLNAMRLRNIINKYSDHILFPIMMHKFDKDKPTEELEKVNSATALWAMPKKDIKEEEYQALYKHISHDFENPLLYSHNRVEGKLEYISLLYIPARAPFDLWQREHRYGLKLYSERVFVMDDAENLLPGYLRFVHGIIDSKDLPLNVSREILQNNKIIDQIRVGIVKRVLEMLEKLAEVDQEKYAKFWQTFGQVLKEGPAEDFANNEKIAKLLRFASTSDETGTQSVSLDTYLSRIQDKQDKIYYIIGDSYLAAKNSPQLEIFRNKNIEVLLLSDRVDEWLVAHLNEYKGKQLQSITRGDLELNKFQDKEVQEKQAKVKAENEPLIARIKTALGDKVKDVRISDRLVDSPVCLVASADDMSIHLQRLMQAAGQAVPALKPILEINPEHPLIQKINNEQSEKRFGEWVEILFGSATLADGGQLANPAEFVKQLNKLFIGV